MSGAPQRFPLRFEPWYAALSTALLLPPSSAWIEVGASEVSCRMGWSFRATFPRDAVVSAERFVGRPLSKGVHGLAGRWLVNGSAKGLVTLALDPPKRAWVLGAPIRLRELIVSVEDPAGLLAALRDRAAEAA
jgi:hypothetical protein